MKKNIILFLSIILLFITISMNQNEHRPFKINTFPEFFEKVHIGMKIEEVSKIFNYKFNILKDKTYFNPYPKLDIYYTSNFYFLEYNKQELDFGTLIYKDIIFQIGISKTQLLKKNNTIIFVKTTIDDYYNIKNEFLSNKEYIVIQEGKKEMQNDFDTKSITLYNCFLMKKNDDKVILIGFEEKIYNEKNEDYLSENSLQIFQYPYSIYLIELNKGSKEDEYKELEQFVNSYLNK